MIVYVNAPIGDLYWKIGYSPDTQELRLVDKSDTETSYQRVPFAKMTGLVFSPDRAAFFNDHIHGQYAAQQVEKITLGKGAPKDGQPALSREVTTPEQFR